MIQTIAINGKRILITSARNYAKRLSEQIINLGGLPILMPTIETCELSDYSELDTALQNIDKYEWIAFTSRNGINAFFQRLSTLNFNSDILSNCCFCAIGKDAERLKELGQNIDLIPNESSPEGIIVDLSKVPNIQGQNILVPVPQVIGITEPNIIPNFVAGLQKLEMKVTRIPAYTTGCLPKNLYTVELNLIKQKFIDVIAFSSSAEVESFLQMVDDKSDYEYCTIACFGPYTAANARSLGLNVSIVSQDFSSFQGFATAIAAINS
ncbi:MAG: uroporphyrinogen-III synthase [Calothrix sp. SM1_7_51]|nr:uroporphyrinogen-III synthase [Calothrix sp. SM1_7_51]